MDHSLQIILLIIICLFSFMIYKMSFSKKKNKQDINISLNIEEDNILHPTNKHKNTVNVNKKQHTNIPKSKKDNPYKEWNESWLSRNTPIKTCYNNCTGLRKHDYIICSEKCISNDRFGK